MVEKAKEASVSSLKEMVTAILPEVETSLGVNDIVRIQVHIQHTDRLLRAALRICRVTFVVTVIAQVQIGIPEYGNQLDLLRIQIDAGYDDRIAPASRYRIPRTKI